MTDTDTGNDSFDLPGFFPGMIGVSGDKGILQCQEDPERGADKMSEKRRVILWTCLAAGLFCMELILISLTPLAKIGNGTRFGSSGMFYNLYMGGGSYLIPLALYCMNVRAMKYVIGCVNGLWLICHPVIALICFGAMSLTGLFKMSYSFLDTVSLLTAGMFALCSFTVGILWYPMCRKKAV